MKKKQSVRKYRLCVLGPSFVGKTQLINRFVNNSFSPYYDPTLKAAVYKRSFSLLEQDSGAEPAAEGEGQIVEVELIDVFPHDHPALDEATGELAQEMSSTLNALVKNSGLEACERLGVAPGLGGSILGKVHGYVYVYDASNKNTFDTLTCLVETVREIEKSERRGKKVVTYTPKKLVLGNKKDLLVRADARQQAVDREQLQKLEINKHRLVSAMTNHGVQEAFRALITDIHSCNILHKELYDEDKKRGPAKEDPAIDMLLGGATPVTRSRGIIGMLPFFNCAQARDSHQVEDEEDQRGGCQIF